MDKRHDKEELLQNKYGGRPWPSHTFTPQSHEDLLKSHLQVDSAKQSRLQNELQRLLDDNKRLRKSLEKALENIQDKDTQLASLNNELRDRIEIPRPSSYQSDGMPNLREELIKHFNVIIKRHHDLLAQKNKQIIDLQNGLIKQPVQQLSPSKGTQVSPANNDAQQHKLMAEFTTEAAFMRKEYEQVDDVLTDRNRKLDKLIFGLHHSLNEYANEVENLREELSGRKNLPPSESTLKLIKAKERENARLKEIIANLKHPSDKPLNNDKLVIEINKVVIKKDNTADRINSLNNKLNKDSKTKHNVPEIKKECQNIKSNLNTLDSRLNDLLNLLNSPVQGDKVDENDLLPLFNNIKNQHEKEINLLKQYLNNGKTSPQKNLVVLPYEFPREILPSPNSSRIITYGQPEKVISFVSLNDNPKKTEQLVPNYPVSRPKHHHLGKCEACSNVKLLDKPIETSSSGALQPETFPLPSELQIQASSHSLKSLTQ